MVNCLCLEENDNRVSLGFSSGEVASVILNIESYANSKLIDIEPEFVVFHHNSEIVWISGNKSNNLLASLDKECILIIQSLTSGTFLNKIVLGPVWMTVQAMWLNTHGYYIVFIFVKVCMNGNSVTSVEVVSETLKNF